MTVQVYNWSTFFLLDLQERLVTVLKKFETRDNEIILCKNKGHQGGLFDQG